MPDIREWSIAGADNQPILGNTHLPDGGTGAAVGVLILCHGFKGYKDYGLFPQLAQRASQAGLICHRFNFSHSGMTNNTDTFEKPELFEKDTWRKQSHDLQQVIRAVTSEELDGKGLPVVVFGHSRGGVTTLLTAGHTDTGKQLAGVITAGSPSQCSGLYPEQVDMLKRVGRLPSPSSRTGQTLYVDRNWQDQIEQDPNWHDPCKAAAKITCPLLIIHGTQDTTVPVIEAQDFHKAQPRAQVYTIQDASHTFNAPNPLPMDEEPPEATKQLFDRVCDFAVGCCQGK